MAKSKGGRGGKERITPPAKKLLSREARALRDGDPGAARVMADASVAKRQHVTRSKRSSGRRSRRD